MAEDATKIQGEQRFGLAVPGEDAGGLRRFGHWSWAYEFAAIIAVIVAAGLLSKRSDPFWLDVRPHPFWAAVLLMALRYGLWPGMLAGGFCALLHLAAVAAGGNQLTMSLHLDMAEIGTAALYPIVGIFVGEAIEHHLRRAEALRLTIEEQRRRIATAEARRGEIEIAYRQLEGRIAGETDTFGALCESAEYLDSLEEEDIYAGLGRLLQRHLAAESVGIWSITADGNVARIVPSTAAETPLPEIGRAALREGRTVDAAALYPQGDEGRSGGLLAGLLRGKDGRAMAVVVIGDMSFVGFTPTAVRTFELLTAWASRSLAKAQQMRASRQREIWEEDLELASPAYLQARAQEELRLATRRQTSAALLAFRCEGQMREGVSRRLRCALARILRHLIRLSDTAAYFADQAAFAIFLPDTDANGAETVKRKLQDAVAVFGFTPYGDGRSLRLRWGIAQSGKGAEWQEMAQRVFTALAQPDGEYGA